MMTDQAVLSIDFELFRHTPAYRSAEGELDDETVGLGAWPFLRDVLSRAGVTATFFIVGEIADEHPETVGEIAAAGHEIAAHTHTHPLLSTVDESTRAEELERSKQALRSVTGAKVEGFRAPAFDVPAGTYHQLADAGYTYDSSIMPARRIPGWYGGEHRVTGPCSTAEVAADAPELGELPLSVSPYLRLPLSGAWTRLLGRTYTRVGMRQLARRGDTPVLYFHPWELVELPAVAEVPTRVTWRTGAWMRETLRRLLGSEFEFVTASTLLGGGDDGR